MTLQADPDVVFRRLGERMVLIQLQTNNIFDLNETSARLWELLVEVGEPAEISARLVAEYDVDPELLRQEITQTLAAFAENDLITGYASR